MSVEGLNEDWMMENNKLSEVTQMQEIQIWYEFDYLLHYVLSIWYTGYNPEVR